MSDKTAVDYQLDVWIDENVYHRRGIRKHAAPHYTKYTNRALFTLEFLEIPFTLSRTEDLMYEIRIYHCVERVKTWEELAYGVCKAIYKLMTKQTWRENGYITD